MTLDTWKKSTLDRPGTAEQFGSRDLNRVSELLNGEDVGPVEIGTDWNFTRPPQGLELPSGYITDAHVSGQAGIAYPKLALQDSITDDDITTHVSSKITLANRLQLPADLLYSEEHQTVRNKTISPSDNTLSGVAMDPIIKRTGWAMPVTAGLRREGILADHTNGTTGTISTAWLSHGLVVQIPTTAATGVQAGLVSPTGGVGITRRRHATIARCRIRVSNTANQCVWFGFTNQTALPINAIPIANAHHGVILGYNDGDGYFTARVNDGAGSAANQSVIGAVAKDTEYHTLQIDWAPSGNVHLVVDGFDDIVTTKLPGLDEGLYFNCVLQTTSTTARTIFFRGVWLEVS